MTLDEAIKHAEEIAYNLEQEAECIRSWGKENDTKQGAINCEKRAEEHRQLADWLKELKVFKSRKGQWLRMFNLSEQEDDRYKCSYCGNVVHYKNKMDLYTFSSWCGRCGSDNGRN